MNDERQLSFPADEQDTPLDFVPEGSQPVSRYLVGLLLLGSDQLAQGLGGAKQPEPEAPPGEETSSDLLRHLAIGAIARAERDAGRSLRTIYYASVGTASWTFRTVDRWTDNRLMRFTENQMVYQVGWWIATYDDLYPVHDRVSRAVIQALRDAGVVLPYTTGSVRVERRSKPG